ncbi:MAG TPA: hypothetical protein VN519_06890 [Bryobacteraceae bacterium]|nr:hypothetical protein [Bryobacteraceae bacterium]
MADPIWLEDQLVGVKKGPDLAKKLNSIPVVGQVVQTVNTVVGLIPANVTTTVETTLDAAALTEIRKIAAGVISFINQELTAAGLPAKDDAVLDADLAAYLKTLTGGQVDITSQFPEPGAVGANAAGESGSSDPSGDGSSAMGLNAGATDNPTVD